MYDLQGFQIIEEEEMESADETEETVQALVNRISEGEDTSV